MCLLFQMQDNKTFLSMINSVLHTDSFYFAADYDLTHSLQRLANTSPEFQEMSLLERVRFTTHAPTENSQENHFEEPGTKHKPLICLSTKLLALHLP